MPYSAANLEAQGPSKWPRKFIVIALVLTAIPFLLVLFWMGWWWLGNSLG